MSFTGHQFRNFKKFFKEKRKQGDEAARLAVISQDDMNKDNAQHDDNK